MPSEQMIQGPDLQRIASCGSGHQGSGDHPLASRCAEGAPGVLHQVAGVMDVDVVGSPVGQHQQATRSARQLGGGVAQGCAQTG